MSVSNHHNDRACPSRTPLRPFEGPDCPCYAVTRCSPSAKLAWRAVEEVVGGSELGASRVGRTQLHLAKVDDDTEVACALVPAQQHRAAAWFALLPRRYCPGSPQSTKKDARRTHFGRERNNGASETRNLENVVGAVGISPKLAGIHDVDGAAANLPVPRTYVLRHRVARVLHLRLRCSQHAAEGLVLNFNQELFSLTHQTSAECYFPELVSFEKTKMVTPLLTFGLAVSLSTGSMGGE